MDLFDNEIAESKNLLPKGGIVNYYGKLFTNHEANHYFDCLLKTIE
jgi:SUMO ligase MMS21 Smc5/6 complex component